MVRIKEWYSKRIEQISKKQEAEYRATYKKQFRDMAKKIKFEIKKEKNKYRKTVISLTNKQELHKLPNISLRGLLAHQIDHIVSINDGFRYFIPHEWIADLSNLRVIDRDVNRIKGECSHLPNLYAMLSKLKAKNYVQ